MTYRPEIDGLRAVAISAVILCHAGFEIFSGGFVGVDIFFVISGYLITSILYEQIGKENFNFILFYKKRARRILPAIYFLLIVLVIYGLYKSPLYSRDLYQSIFATTLFAENILLYYEGLNYFGLQADKKPLLHTWSLGIEEQFYLLWPLLLFALFKFCKSITYLIIISLLLVSLSYANYESNINPSFSFYMIFSRSWELLAGSLIVFYTKRKTLLLKPYSNFSAIFGLLLIIFSIIFFDEATKTPSFITLIPVSGTVLILLFANKNNIVGKLLSKNFLVFIGLISYSLYIWHQPIFAIAKDELSFIKMEMEHTIFLKLILISITLIMAILSYFLIEKPARYVLTEKKFIISTVSITIFLLGISIIGHFTKGFENFKLNQFQKNNHLYIDHYDEVDRKIKYGWGKIKNKQSKVLIIGDSMGKDLQLGFLLNHLSADYLEIDGSCFELLLKNKEACNKNLNEILGKIKRYEYIFISSDFLKERSEYYTVELWKKFRKFTPTYVIGSLRFKHASEVSYEIISKDVKNIKNFFHDFLDKRIYIVNSTLKEKLKSFFVDKYGIFCKKNSCKLYDDQLKPLFHDELHTTIEGSKIYGKYIIENYLSIKNK